MCSNDIEDLSKLMKKEEEIDPQKLENFMALFLEKCSQIDSSIQIEKLFNKIKREKRIN